ncbi:hypothetical protein F4805DRAFT_366090 [Annulohypoxylon moriforme]|nr:hypothetical protein F4805DRAFT_366090 [Annulohypoxylon moriforme]
MEETQISTDKLMQERTFTNFSHLPKELRDIIWDFAIQDERPKAHFFLVTGEEEPDPASLRYECKQFLKATCTDCRVFVPWYSTESTNGFHRSTYDQSGHLIDSGLWTACRESRDAIRRRFQKAGQDGPRMLGPAGRTGAFATYSDGEREDQYFTIRNYDLVCFRNLDKEKDIAKAGILTNLPFVTSEEYVYRETLPRDGVKHVAIEYNPNWDTPTEHAIRYCTGPAFAMVFFPSLWFIDYRIRRTKDPSRSRANPRENRHVFYGNGCRLVSVRPSDTEWEFEDGTPLSVEEHNVFGFTNELKKSNELDDMDLYYSGYESDREAAHEQDQLDYEDLDLWDDPTAFQHKEPCGNLGVLAFELDE